MEDTKKCPYCGEEIKTVAKKCRHCGEWLEETVKPQSPSNEGVPRGKSNTPKYLLIGGCVVVAVVIALVLIFRSNPTGENYTDGSYENETTVIEAVKEPSTIDQIEARMAEYDANQTPEEKAQEPWRIHLNKLQGSYLIDKVSTAADLDMIHNYGKYVISGNTITKYEWNESSDSWQKVFSSDFQLFKFQEDGYMTGYNLIYTDQYGNECRMCSGDLNEDGVMDLWQSGSIFWTKQ